MPDIRTEKPLWISSSPSLNLANQNLRPGNGEGDKQARDAQGRNKEHIEGLSASGDSDGMSIEIPSISEAIILILTKIASCFRLPQCLKKQRGPLFEPPSVYFQVLYHSNEERTKNKKQYLCASW